jgi:hypothetical protein
MQVGIVGMGAIGGFIGVKPSTVTPMVVLDRVRPEPRPPIENVTDVQGRSFTRGDLTVTTDPAGLAICKAVHEHERAEGQPDFLSPESSRARVEDCL